MLTDQIDRLQDKIDDQYISWVDMELMKHEMSTEEQKQLRGGENAIKSYETQFNDEMPIQF